MIPLRTLVTSEEMFLPHPKVYARSTVLRKDRDILASHFPPLDASLPLTHSLALGEPNQDASCSRTAAKLKGKQAPRTVNPSLARVPHIYPLYGRDEGGG